ncbi:unnamed protein product [Triticum turgidum subsp. durum]|uniref:Trichome birefringence-like C-terminal domain-containing protein n=1 Tax=Triticum turgidum subsp. durum TaxID=4567 RepID=A0A9R0VJW0_TRITD|nr:unnamed protein product [Triticum turgidum subsp. durum]
MRGHGRRTRFDGRDLLSRWKGKKVLFVGDSISLNQWESLVCMLHAAAPASRTSYSRGNPVSTVTFQVRAVPCMFQLRFGVSH